jgi:hypothetical protein
MTESPTGTGSAIVLSRVVLGEPLGSFQIVGLALAGVAAIAGG